MTTVLKVRGDAICLLLNGHTICFVVGDHVIFLLDTLNKITLSFKIMFFHCGTNYELEKPHSSLFCVLKSSPLFPCVC